MAFDLNNISDASNFTGEPVTAHLGEIVLLRRVSDEILVNTTINGTATKSPAVVCEFATVSPDGDVTDYGETNVFGTTRNGEPAGLRRIAMSKPQGEAFGGRLSLVEFGNDGYFTYEIDSQDATYRSLTGGDAK